MIQRFLLLVLISAVSLTTFASDNSPTFKDDVKNYFNDHFDFAGYVGYRYIYSLDDRATPTPVASGPELGLLFNWNINDNFTAFTQLRFDEIYPSETIAYAHLEYSDTFFNNKFPLIITAGKLRHRFGLYNAGRLNPRTRQGVVMPQGVYWDQLRFVLTSGYGFSVASHWNNKLHFKYTLYAPVIVDELEEALIWTSGHHTTIESKLGIHLFNLDYISDTWRATGTLSFLNFGEGKFRQTTTYNLGLEKQWNDFTFSVEGAYVSKEDSSGTAFSTTIAYDINELWSVHANYNQYNAYFETQPPVVAFLGSDHFNSAHDTSVGVTFHKDNWEIRTDIHAVQGSVWVDFRKALDPVYADTWYYGAASIVYHFE
jgi:hypothetical protein